ncbi:MAG: excinuclease ABC subunit A, partial [Candidatus Azotimanducaceae bacterium]
MKTASEELDHILIRGAREHNLKSVEVKIPKRKLVVFTGVSGSGKSSLAFDTLYAEGQRRYVESLSAYARQFLGQMEKPKYDMIRGLSPTISIEQKTTGRNPRSTVGTITEISDYLRVLYARVGIQHCHLCHREVQSQTAQHIAKELSNLPEGTRLLLLVPLLVNRKGEHREMLADA